MISPRTRSDPSHTTDHTTQPGSPLPQLPTARLCFPGRRRSGIMQLVLSPPASGTQIMFARFLSVRVRYLEVTVSSLCLAHPLRWNRAGTHLCISLPTAPGADASSLGRRAGRGKGTLTWKQLILSAEFKEQPKPSPTGEHLNQCGREQSCRKSRRRSHGRIQASEGLHSLVGANITSYYYFC